MVKVKPNVWTLEGEVTRGWRKLLIEELRNVDSLAADQVSEYGMGEYEAGKVGVGAHEFLIIKREWTMHFGDLYTAERECVTET